MINLYSGTPGSGKSLHSARDLFIFLGKGIPCICNFDVNTDLLPRYKGGFYYVRNDAITPEFLIKFSHQYYSNHRFREGGIKLYLDECQLLFNAREWNKKGRNEWLSFFTQHRKYGYEIYLIAQFDRMIDRQIRSLIEYEYIHRKVSNFGTFGKILSLVGGGKLFVSVKIWYPLKEKVGSEFFRASSRYYSIYDTYNTFGVDNIDEPTL